MHASSHATNVATRHLHLRIPCLCIVIAEVGGHLVGAAAVFRGQCGHQHGPHHVRPPANSHALNSQRGQYQGTMYTWSLVTAYKRVF